MRNLKNILLNITVVVAVLLVPAVVFGATTVGDNVSVGGTLGVTGASTLTNVSSTNYSASGYLDVNGVTTLDGAVTLGDAVGDSITVTGKLGTIYISNGTTTSTLARNSLSIAEASGYKVGLFYVDSSGNVTASGTLGIIGATTLTNVSSTNYSASGYLDVNGATTLDGAVTLGDAYADSVTVTGRIASALWASSTLYVGSAGAGDDFIVTDNAVSVGTSVNSSTLAVYSNATLTGSLLAQTGHNNLYDLGAYGSAWNDVFTSGTVYLNTLNAGTNGAIAITGRFSSAVWASSTLYVGAANDEELIVTDDAVTVGTATNSSTLAVYSNATLTGSLLAQTGHNNLYNIGAFGSAFKDAYVSSTLFVGDLSDLLYIDKPNSKIGMGSSTPFGRVSIGAGGATTSTISTGKFCLYAGQEDGVNVYVVLGANQAVNQPFATTSASCF